MFLVEKFVSFTHTGNGQVSHHRSRGSAHHKQAQEEDEEKLKHQKKVL